MERKVELKWQEVLAMTNLSNLKKMVIESFIHDPVLQEALLKDSVGSMCHTAIFLLPEDYSSYTAQALCVHGVTDRYDGYCTQNTEAVPLYISTHLANKSSLYTGKCPTCGRLHIAIKPCKNV